MPVFENLQKFSGRVFLCANRRNHLSSDQSSSCLYPGGMSEWKSKLEDRIELVDPTQLLAHPSNARRHPGRQRDALRASLDEVGFIAPVVVNRTTDRVLDGHARVEEAITAGVEVPVVYVEIPGDKEAYVLATFDPISAMAEYDQQGLTDLLLEIETTGAEELDAMLAGIADLDLNVDYAETETPFTYENVDSVGDVGEESSSLVERFGVPPFTVLDSRQGYWQERKRAWKMLGMDSGDGRDEELTFREGDDFLGAENARLGSTSLYDPVLCETIYRWFTPNADARILDPFAGGVTRGAVAARLGCRYTGIDIRAEQVAANEAQHHLWDGFPAPEWVVGDARNTENLVDGEYDLLHTCPPYADLEKYSDDDGDLSGMDPDEFLEAHAGAIGSACERLADNRFAVWTVGEVRHSKKAGGPYLGFVPSTIAAFEKAGLVYYNEMILIIQAGTASLRAAKQMQSGRKPCRTHQTVLVFYKGDPAEIKTHFPPIEIENIYGEELTDDGIAE